MKIRPVGVVRAFTSLAMALVASLVLAAGPLPTPAGAAYLKAERVRIERDFVTQVARIAGVSAAAVRRGMPDAQRITDTGRRVIASLEQQRGAPLSAAQRAAIEAADAQREAALVKARDEAARR